MSSQPSGQTEWPQSQIISRLDVSNPEEDNARERVRDAEAHGLQVVNSDAQQADYGSPPTSSQRRQDFSHEKPSRRDTRLGNYILGRTLGEGEFGKVKLGWKQGGSTQVAVKIIRKEKLHDKARMDKVLREVKILQGLDHPNIVRLHEMVETDRTMGIVLEYAPCGELFNFILNQRYLKDHHAKRLFAQLVSAVGYLHRKGIIHRDLKLENLLLDRNHNIIVTDFGFANRFNPADELGEHIEANLHDRKFVAKYRLAELDVHQMRRGDLMATSCGSPCYAAPELVISDGLYTGRKVDVWSIGVILYAMLAGYLPYDDDPRNPDGDNINLLYSYISETDLKFPDYVTPHARDLLKRILRPDPRVRADLFEVARHSWLVGYESVVEAVTSIATNPAEVSGTSTTDGSSMPPLARSASARAASNPVVTSNAGGLISKQGNIGEAQEFAKTKPTPREQKRQTVQVEYMPPQQSQQGGRDVAGSYHISQPQEPQAQPYYAGQQRRPAGNEDELNRGQFPSAEADAPMSPPKSAMSPPTRPYREVPRSVTDPNMGLTSNRPNTQGSLVGSRLPSRSSYGQPVAAQVATTSAQGHLSQPRPISQYGQVTSTQEQPGINNNVGGYHQFGSSTQEPVESAETAKYKRGHARSQTLTDLTQRVFGRSSSVRKPAGRLQKPDRSHPPTSLRPMDSPTTSRKSSDSRRSFVVAGQTNNELSTNAKRSSRRFSLIPRWASSKTDLTPPPTSEMREQPQGRDVYSSPFDGTQSVSTRPQDPISSGSPSSYKPPTQINYRNAPDPSARAASAGIAETSSPSWQTYGSQFGASAPPSRFQSPAVPIDRREQQLQPLSQQQQQQQLHPQQQQQPQYRSEKPQYDVQNLGPNRKMHRGGPAQRVMDFFSGRRHKRSGMA